MMYREVNSGGSFGCLPLRHNIGTATIIDTININLPAPGIVQAYKKVIPDQYLKLLRANRMRNLSNLYRLLRE
ncbi:hypothetical protein [Ferruginibacter profundus]